MSKKLYIYFVASLLAFGGCGSAASHSPQISTNNGGNKSNNGNQPPPPVLPPQKSAGPLIGFQSPLIRYLGRTEAAETAQRMSYPGTGFVANFYGTSLMANMNEEGTGTQAYDAANPTLEDFHDYYNVTIDDNTFVFHTYGESQWYTLASNLLPGLHTVRLVRREDPSIATNDFMALQTSSDGYFVAPPAAKPHRIEFVGASAISGMAADGNQSIDNCNDWETFVLTNNADHSLPQIAANLLNAELSNASYSGRGLYYGYASGGIADPNATDLLWEIYPLTIPDDPNTGTNLWNFSQFVPDVIVIDGGGIDPSVYYYNFPGTNNADTDPNIVAAMYEPYYYNYIREIRAANPYAVIFCTLDTMSYPDSSDGAAMRIEVGNAYKQALALEETPGNLIYYEFPSYDPIKYGLGCESHPTFAGNTYNAQQIATVIKAKMNW